MSCEKFREAMGPRLRGLAFRPPVTAGENSCNPGPVLLRSSVHQDHLKLSAAIKYFSVGVFYQLLRLAQYSLTCVSERLRAVARSTLSGVERYLCASNRRSRPHSCASENTVRAFRRRQCLLASLENSDENDRPEEEKQNS